MNELIEEVLKAATHSIAKEWAYKRAPLTSAQRAAVQVAMCFYHDRSVSVRRT